MTKKLAISRFLLACAFGCLPTETICFLSSVPPLSFDVPGTLEQRGVLTGGGIDEALDNTDEATFSLSSIDAS